MTHSPNLNHKTYIFFLISSKLYQFFGFMFQNLKALISGFQW